MGEPRYTSAGERLCDDCDLEARWFEDFGEGAWCDEHFEDELARLAPLPFAGDDDALPPEG